jgi:geranylgeranyl reductase family protein
VTAPGSIYDLIIVGAGPAGTTAALYAARCGLSALLLDKAKFPRDKTCGDALGGKAVAVLRELGLLGEVAALPGASVRTIVFGSPSHAVAHIDLTRAKNRDFVTGFVIRRFDFDNFLFEKARAAGTDCRDGTAVEDLIVEDGGVHGVRCRDAQGRRHEFHGRLVLGADGYQSIVARKRRLYDNHPADSVFALRRYYRNVSVPGDQIELHYVKDVCPGYLWIFPTGGGEANVGIGMLTKAMSRRRINLVDMLELQVRSREFGPRFARAEPMERATGWHLPIGSKRRKSYGPGFLLLGDAAGLIDPFTGEGIANAMLSARRAVEVARESIDAGDASEAFLSRFEERLWNEIGDELAMSSRLQKIAQFRPLLNFTIWNAARNVEVRDLICAMIAQERPRTILTSPLFYLRLLVGATPP